MKRKTRLDAGGLILPIWTSDIQSLLYSLGNWSSRFFYRAVKVQKAIPKVNIGLVKTSPVVKSNVPTIWERSISDNDKGLNSMPSISSRLEAASVLTTNTHAQLPIQLGFFLNSCVSARVHADSCGLRGSVGSPENACFFPSRPFFSPTSPPRSGLKSAKSALAIVINQCVTSGRIKRFVFGIGTRRILPRFGGWRMRVLPQTECLDTVRRGAKLSCHAS